MKRDVFSAIGDPNRRRILELLAVGPRAVGELASELGIAQPSVTQHLGLLREVGAVDFDKRGNASVYRLLPGALDEVTTWVSALNPQNDASAYSARDNQ
jgi:DNA-binding transcriptional ArsR family regulator